MCECVNGAGYRVMAQRVSWGVLLSPAAVAHASCAHWSGAAAAWLRVVAPRFTGEIPASALVTLTSLEHLKLSWNKLTGTLPPELWSMPSLRYLELTSNQLHGSLSPDVGQLANLTRLQLGYNLLTGSIPATLGTLQVRCLCCRQRVLRAWRLEWCARLGMWIDAASLTVVLGFAQKLRHLHLYSNGLEGPLPASLAQLQVRIRSSLWHHAQAALTDSPTRAASPSLVVGALSSNSRANRACTRCC